MSDKDQINRISELLLEYSAGNYSFKAEIGEDLNELDMIISGINMLGEELESSNVSTEYFSSIFNAVSDLVIIIDKNDEVKDANEAFSKFFSSKDFNYKETLDAVLENSGNSLKSIKAKLENKRLYQFETWLRNDHVRIDVVALVSKIINRFDEFEGYLFSFRDVSAEKESEKAVLKAIFITQQNEQKRVADDLHDSLGQELSMTKLMLSHLKKEVGEEEKALKLVNTCSEIMEGSIKHLREICFNLMPGVLNRGGLGIALKDLVSRLERQNDFKTIIALPDIPRIDPELEVAIYRIAQEFINNMIKHSNADELELTLDFKENESIKIHLKDNGQGFNMQELEKVGENRGYSNLKSKTQAFNGELVYKSEIGKGTFIILDFPL